MLITEATVKVTNKIIMVTHCVINEGKPTEEHHFGMYLEDRSRPLRLGDQFAGYVMDAEAAKELKAHL
jgi:hypothetical protein